MTRRKGELSAGQIDRGWPHQVALKQLDPKQNFERSVRIEALSRTLSLAPRGHSVVFEDEWWQVYCFAAKADAEWFRREFGGEPFDPKDRGRGDNWMQWRKPS